MFDLKLNLSLVVAIIGIVGSSYAIFGGLKSVAVSDTLNGIGLLIGGLTIPFLALAKARNGIVNPPIRRPIPFNVSLTATDFNPPKIAYELPTIPIIATTNDRLSFKSNIVINAKDPV